MMRGLLAKTVREVWVATLLIGLGLLAVERVLLFILPQIQGQVGALMESLPFLKVILKGLFGVDPEGQLSSQLFQALVWVHPVVLSLIWAHEILLCTRLPAGEIDRGTIDILLGLPVSRRFVFLAESVVWILSGAVVIGLGSVGYFWGAASLEEDLRPATSRVLLVLANLGCLYVAVGGVAFLVSALSNRRGKAVGVVFGLLLASFLLNFLCQMWEPARPFAFLGVLDYYQPGKILEAGTIPFRSAATLLGVGGLCWMGGLEVFARRSICTA